MSEESPESSFFKDMITEIMEKDPKMALAMMMAAFKLPILVEFISEHKDELDQPINVTMKTGEALFLFGSCMHSIGSLGSNQSVRHDGNLHVHVLKDYSTAGMIFAKLVDKIGYPEQTAIADMAEAIACVDVAFEHAAEIHGRIRSGEINAHNIDDMINREVQ